MPVSVQDWLLYFVTMLLPAAAIAYFCGCFNGAVIMSKYILRDDVRAHGSGNAGLTNFYRTFGGSWTIAVLLTDVLKAVLALLIVSALLGGTPFSKYWGSLFVILGHMFPCVFHFKGGKGILSGGVAAIMIDWRVALVVWGGFILLVLLTRYVSLGSCYAGVAFPFVSWFVYRNIPILLIATVCGILILWQHRWNIQRLIHGTENKFSFHKKREKGDAA